MIEKQYLVKRLTTAPIVSRVLFDDADGDSICGPSLIMAPTWLSNPVARFYLYFSHHKGKYIRLACANTLEGPWRLVGPTLKISDTASCLDHIASPDVHVCYETMTIKMYFHSKVSPKGQRTFLAYSSNGIDFVADGEPIVPPYLRLVLWGRRLVGMVSGGVMYASEPDGQKLHRIQVNPFEQLAIGKVRHVALRLKGNQLEVFYSCIGDMPESIKISTIDLSRPVEEWQASKPVLLLQPELSWEGADLPPVRSQVGMAKLPENALRDPAIFEWNDRCFLLYTGSGEQALGIAELIKID